MTAISKRALALFAFAACSVTCVASSAYAQTLLNWNAPAACPDEAAVQSAIGRALDPAAKQHSAVEVDADVEQAGVGYVLTLSVRTASGTSRERLEASDCGLLVRVIVLKVSLLASESGPQALASAIEPAAYSGAREPPRPESIRAWSVRAQLQLAAAQVPAPAFGVAIGAGYRVGPVRLEILASYLAPRQRSFPEHPGVGGRFQAWTGALRACAVSPWPASFRLELAGCAGIEGGFTRGRGLGVSPANVTDRPSLALGAGVNALLAIGPVLGVRADVEALFGLVRPDFYVRNLGVLHRAPSVGARGLLGIELRWP